MDSVPDETKKDCCSKNSCGCQQGCRKSCCGGKALLALVLLLIGGLIGYTMGVHCGYGRQKTCVMEMMSKHCPMPTEATK